MVGEHAEPIRFANALFLMISTFFLKDRFFIDINVKFNGYIICQTSVYDSWKYFTNITKGTTDLKVECICQSKGWVPEKRIFSFGHSPIYLSTQKNTNLNAILRTKVTFEKLLPQKQRFLVLFLPRDLYKIRPDYFGHLALCDIIFGISNNVNNF